MGKYAPIIIFAFNRPEAFRATIDALRKCNEAKESDLYIFIDGPRPKVVGDADSVMTTREIAQNVSGFKSVTCHSSDTNQGLGPSIINGVKSIIVQYGKAIVLEDDLIVNQNFLAFMNLGLNRYEREHKIWSICGYTNNVTPPENYPYDAYFCTRSSSWGWGTWKDRWDSVDWTFDHWEEWTEKKKTFNKWGGSDCFRMLQDCKEGRNKSWAIRFCFNQFLQDKISLFPIKSLVVNVGFDGHGTNCRRYSRFKYELMPPSQTYFHLPKTSIIDRTLWRQAMRYNSIAIRIWSRFMYMIRDGIS